MIDNSQSIPVTQFYRIGEFAKYLGVTPDLLKLYEQHGILKSVQAENGYRYYRFQDAIHIFECMKLKNQGFTLREMEPILSTMSEEDVIASIFERKMELEKEVQFKSALLQEFDEFTKDIDALNGKDADWSISSSEAFLFLPHTRSRSFIDDPRIYELLPHWVRWMPIVHSAALFTADHPSSYEVPEWFNSCVWGMVVPEHIAEKYQLPVNDVVQRLPASKSLNYLFTTNVKHTTPESSNYATVWKLLDNLHLNAAGYILEIDNMAIHLGNDFGQNQKFIVPLEGLT